MSKPRRSKLQRAQLRAQLDAKVLAQTAVTDAMSAEGARIRAERGLFKPPTVTIPEIEEGVTE